MIKKLNFVRDKKSGDVMAPQFVPSHVFAIRNYIAVTDSDKEVILRKFPEDFELVTVDFDGDKGCTVSSTEVVTSFIDIVRSERGDSNGGES